MNIQFYDNQYLSGAVPIELIAADASQQCPPAVLACDDPEVRQQLVDALVERFDNGLPFSALQMGELLDHALVVDGKRRGACNVALLVYHKRGATALQLGSGRIIQVRGHARAMLYDSRDQAPDIYSSKAKVMEIVDIANDDFFIVTTATRFDTAAMVDILSNASLSDEQKGVELAQLLAGTDASMLLQHISEVTGVDGIAITDLSAKWIVLTILLILAIAAVAAIAIFPKLLKF